MKVRKLVPTGRYVAAFHRRKAVLLAVLLTLFSLPGLAGQGSFEELGLELLEGTEIETQRSSLETLLSSGDRRVGPFLKAYLGGDIHRWRGQYVSYSVDSHPGEQVVLLDAFERSPRALNGKPLRATVSELGIPLSPPRRLRRAIQGAVRVFGLLSEYPKERLESAGRLGDSRDPAHITFLEKALSTEADEKVKYTLTESVAIIRLHHDGTPYDARLESARLLGEMKSLRAASIFEDLLKEIDGAGGTTASDTARKVYSTALGRIESYEQKVRVLGYVFAGVSLGSILILMALGLSIIFGQMGVINMAHGEMMMVGAYATFWVHEIFATYLPESFFNWYFVASLPVAFVVAAAVGFVTERLIVRHLYGRPLETLLATWGVSLVLIQAIRLLHGDNSAINNPTWLRGGAEIFHGLVLPYNRCFIIVLCFFALLAIRVLMNRTRFGLRVRATVQNRDMADSLGVRTRRVDGMTFALGAGLAGVAGYALTLIGGITPDMGQNYIVDSFLVVVTGGVGELLGTVGAGLGLGLLNKFLEPSTGAVWGKVLILVVVVVFIQWKPEGLFPPKGRVADA